MPDQCKPDKPLMAKLGIKPGFRISVVGIQDEAFLRDLPLQVATPVQRRVAKNSDLIFLGVESKADLERLMPIKKYLVSNGNVWVVYPKGQKHITQADVMAAMHAAGVVDNKVVSFSTTHTGLRACIPLAMRVGTGA